MWGQVQRQLLGVPIGQVSAFQRPHTTPPCSLWELWLWGQQPCAPSSDCSIFSSHQAYSGGKSGVTGPIPASRPKALTPAQALRRRLYCHSLLCLVGFSFQYLSLLWKFLL